MTRRERLEMVIKGELNDELIADCKRELEKLDARLAEIKVKNEDNIHYNENKTVEQAILEVLGEEPLQIDEIRERVAPDFTRQRVTAICTNLIREGKIQSVDLKIKGKGVRKGYVK